MISRHLSLLLTLLVAGAGAAGAVQAAEGSAFDIIGKYERIQPPQPTQVEDAVEVVDVFWYGCPHCYNFLPHMERWEENKPAYALVRRMPAIFRESWVAHAKAYYTAKLLDVVEEIHRPLFEEIHLKGRRMNRKRELADFFARFGVSRTDFAETFDSFAVESNLQRAIAMQDRYGVMGTPTVIVNGKYRVTGSLAGSYPNMVRVIDALVKREHEARTASE